MKLKKLLAAVTAAALAVSTMAVTSFTASAAAAPIFEAVKSLEWDNSSFTNINVPDVAGATVNLGYTNAGSWANGKVYANSNAGMKETVFSVSDHAAGTTADVDLEIDGSGWWFQIGYAEYGGGSLTVNSIALKDAEGNVLSTLNPTSGNKVYEKNFSGSFSDAPANATKAIISMHYTDGGEWDNGKIGIQGTGMNEPTYFQYRSSANTHNTELEEIGDTATDVELEFTSTNGNYTLTAEEYGNGLLVIDSIKFESDGGSEPGEVSVTVTPATADVKAGETVQLTAAVTGKDDAVVTWESTNTKVATVNASGLVTGVAKGSCEIRALVDGEFLQIPTSFSVVTVNEESGTTPAVTEEWIEDTKTGTFTYQRRAQLPTDVDENGDPSNSSPIDALTVDIASKIGVPKDDFSKITYISAIIKSTDSAGGCIGANDGTTWKQESYTASASGTKAEIEINGTNSEAVTIQFWWANFGAKIEVSNITVVADGKTYTYGSQATDPGDDGDDDNTDRIYALLWEGTKAMPADWSGSVEIDLTDILSKIKVGDKIVSTIVPSDGAQFSLKYKGDYWPGLPGFAAANNGHDYTNPITATTYTHIVTAEDIEAMALGLVVSGHDYTLTKVELNPDKKPADKPPVIDPGHTHNTATAWSSNAEGHWHACSGCTEKFNFAAHTSDGGTVTTPATATTAGIKTYKCTVCGYTIGTESIPATGTSNTPAPWNPPAGVAAPVIPTTGVNNSQVPTVNGQSGWEAVSAEIRTASDGDKIVVEMNSATKVPSTILGDMEGKDVDVTFNMGRGIAWTVNGLSITSRKTIDFDVSKNTRHIPDEVVEKAEGSHKKQISLDHKGNFGCTAALTYEVGTKYNGLYANLFYYNPKTEQLEFADCSLVSGGKATFMFTHASDYLITISDEPLGEFEDVSSAAGIVSDNGVIGNGAAISTVLAVLVLGFGIVVYRKRRHN